MQECVRSGPRKSCDVEGDILTLNCHSANDNDESISIAFLHNTFISVPVTLGVTFNLGTGFRSCFVWALLWVGFKLHDFFAWNAASVA